MNINKMSLAEAVQYYSSTEITTHHLYGQKADVKSPGKQPVLKNWHKVLKNWHKLERSRVLKDRDFLKLIENKLGRRA